MSSSVVCIAPYLPIRARLRVGSWTLDPIAQASEVLAGRDLKFAERLASAYGITASDRHGAVVTRPAHRNAPPSKRAVHLLNMALMLGVLDANDGASGSQQCTAENALVFGHPVGNGQFTVWDEGVLVSTRRAISLRGTESNPVSCGDTDPRPLASGRRRADHGAAA